MDLKEKVRIIEDFPFAGISFKDITPLLSDPDVYVETINQLEKVVQNLDEKPDIIVAPESRGFFFGIPLSFKMGIGFAPARKPGKLPCEVVSQEYTLEYGTNSIEMHKDAISPGTKVLIVDDLIATGGTLLATAQLVEKMGGDIVGMIAVIELTDIGGLEKLKKYNPTALISYPY
ncbi:Adenine phosphoribosyltransferase [Methanosarcinaceae archaeon Ag5]|uniref:Adenine phosphoribosyltransferase n=1 Tax=Methanolapillus africanus TaxID=3028297 RepID=A0AAE4SD84_9EURY|nr:Adenine phosphoribosyltransferase [Methanosarcinaceae archaeon Ag5]